MGGYAQYVWSVFCVAVLMIVGITLAPRYLHKKAIGEVEKDQLEERDDLP